MATKTTDNIEPKALMSSDEQARWDALPPGEHLCAEVFEAADTKEGMQALMEKRKPRFHDL